MIQAILLGLGLGGILGLVLGIANKEFEVPEDPRFEKLTGLLSGYNCGACGYPGCAGLARAILDKEVDGLPSYTVVFFILSSLRFVRYGKILHYRGKKRAGEFFAVIFR